MKQLSNKIQTILAELNKFKRIQEASIESVEGSYGEKLQEIRELRKLFNAVLDELENTTLKEMDEIRTTLQASLKKDVDNCSRLKDELQQLGEAVQGLNEKSKKEIQFIASRKCLDKIQESESYLMENPCMVGRSIIFQANTDIVQYLSNQSSLGRIEDSMQSLLLKMTQEKQMTVKRTCRYNVKISKDTSQNCVIRGICCLASGQVIIIILFIFFSIFILFLYQHKMALANYPHFFFQVIVADYNKRVKMLDKHYNVSSHCDVPGSPLDICPITSRQILLSLALRIGV